MYLLLLLFVPSGTLLVHFNDVLLNEESNEHNEETKHHTHRENPFIQPWIHIITGGRVEKAVKMDAEHNYKLDQLR